MLNFRTRAIHMAARTVLELDGGAGARFTITSLRTRANPDDVWPHDGATPICWASVWLTDSGEAEDLYFRADDELIEHGTNTAAA